MRLLNRVDDGKVVMYIHRMRLSIPNPLKRNMPATNAASMVEKKIKGRKRHIITDTLGHRLGVIVHAANLHDTIEGQRICLQVADRYPSIQAFLADQGYRGTTVTFVQEWLNRRVDIADKASNGFQVQPQRWVVVRTLAWLGNWRRLAKDFEIRTETAGNMIRIAMLKITVTKCAKL